MAHNPTNRSGENQRRMVVMGPETSVYDAARALEANHIGCVLVADGDRVLGILTDRDLALRVIGFDLDAGDAKVRDVMTTDVATLPVTATAEEVARVMANRHVRRVPLEDQGRVIGIVTFDDLVLRGFDPASLCEIVRAQLAEPTALKEEGAVHPTTPVHHRWNAPALDQHAAERRAARRHAAHAQASYESLIRRVLDETGLDTREAAEAALETVLAGIIQRITPEEAADMVSQLPTLLRERLEGVSNGPDRHVTRESIEQVLCLRLDIEPRRANDLVTRLGRVLETALTSGELADVRAQLPPDLRSVFS